MRSSRISWLLLSLITCVSFTTPGVAAPVGRSETPTSPGSGVGGGRSGKDTGIPIAPDSWRGFDQLSPTVQTNLRRGTFSPEASPLQPPNVRANDITGDIANETQGEVTVAAWNQYVVVVWFDSKGADGGPQIYPDAYIGYAYSCDFGATFTDGGSPPRLAANDLPYQGEVAVDDAGTFYLAANYGVNLDASGNWGQDANVVYAGHFTGCAFSWDPPVIASTATSTQYFDMPYIATGPVPGTLHIVQSRYENGLATVEVVTSTDGGTNWGPPATVTAPGRIDDPSIATGPNGEVYVTYLDDWWGYYQCDLSSPNWYVGVRFSRSLDGGATFSSPTLIAYKTNNLRLNTGPGVWRGWDVTPTDVAVDKSGGPRDGAIYVTWQESGAWPAPVETGNFVTEVEPNDTPATALTVSLGDSAVGTSSPGESDYWRFSLTQGQSAILRLEPDDFSCANNSTAQRYVFRLYSDPADPSIAPPDTLLAYSNTGVWLQQIVFTAHKTGDYYARVQHVSGSTSGYTLRTAAITMGPDAATPARDEGDIVAVVSTDGGTTFSSKVLVSGDAPAGLREDFPAVAVDGSGTAWFSWFDRRETDTTPGAVNTAQLTDVYLRGSDDLLSTFSPGERVTDESSTNSGFPRVIFGYNDFHGLWADGGHLMAAWGDQRGSNAATSHFDAYANFLDLEPPTTAFEISPAESAYVAASPVLFEWTGTDRKSATSNLEYATDLDGGGYGAYSPDTTMSVDVSEGWHAFSVRARDEAGNEGDPATLDFALDLTPPSVSITTGPGEGQAVVTSDVSFAWDGSDNLTPAPDLEYAYQLDGGGFSSWDPATTVDLTGLGLGAHAFDLKVRDLSGRTAQITRNFSVDDAVRWNVDASGDWGTASNWNTGTVPTLSDSVVIDRPAGTYAVTVSGGDQAARTVTCEENLVLANGFLTVSGDLLVHAGLSLAGGRLVGATVLSGPATVATYSSGCTLNGVVLGAELSPAIANAGLYVENGLTLQGGTVNLSGAASLIFLGSQTVGGTGEIVFTDDNPVNMIRNNAGGDVLTVGPGVTIHGQQGQIMTSNDYGYLVNQGIIRGEVASGSGISIWRLVSSSNLIEATDGGTVQIVSGTWANTGTLRAQNGGTLDLGGAVTTAGLGTWEGATGTVRLTGTLDNTGDTFTVSDATGSPVLYGNNSRITGGTVDATGSAGLLYDGGTLDGVTLAASTSQGIANAILNVENELTLQTGTVNIGQGASVVFKSGSQAMSGTGEVVFTDGSSANQIRGNAVDDTLTVANGITIRGERGTIMSSGDYGYLVNQGTIRADVPNGSGGIGLWNLVSTSNLIEADGGSVAILSGTWTNTGTLRAQNGGNLGLGGATTTAGLGTWEGVTGSVFLTGILDNTGDTFAISDATGSPVLYSQGRIIGGAVQSTGSAQLLYQGGTLDAVTLDGAASPASPSSVLSVESGMTLQGGTVNIGQGAIVALKGTQTVGGTGEIVFTDGNATNQIRGNAAADTVTVASGVTIHGQRGTVMSSGDYGYLVNQGVILADVADAVGISIWKLVSTSNLVEADGGGTVQILSGTWTNTGTLRAQNGSILDAGGSTTTAGLGTWEGVTGTFRLAGVLDNTGDTFTVSDATGSPVLYGNGTITGGTVQATGLAQLLYQGGTLDGVTLAGPASPAASSSYLHVDNDLALQAGTVNLGQGGQLIFQGSLRLGGTGDIVFTDGNVANLIQGNNAAAGDSLVIGAGVSVRGERGAIQYDTSSAAVFLNQGTIRADVASGVGISVGTNGVENQGTLEATNGGTLQCPGVLLSTGTVHAGGGSSILLQGVINALNAGDVIVDDTGTLFASSSVLLQGAVLRGSGTVDASVENFSQIAPGASPGTLTITGNMSEADTASILTELGGSEPAAYDRLLIGQTASLAGTLNVALLDGYSPAPEDTFTVLEYGNLSGAFDQINFPPLPGGMEWLVDAGASAFQIITSSADTVPPVTALVTAPPDMGWIAQDSVYVSWTATDDRSSPEAMLYSYELDGGGATPFTVADTSATFTGLATGPHTFSVTSQDEAGNTDPTPVGITFTVDLTAPSAFFASGPEEGATADTADVVFTWHGSDDLAPEDSLTFAYQLDGGGFSPFAPDTMATFSGLAEGPHSVDVKSRDLAGNESAPASRSFFVDLTAPVVSFTAGPAEGAHLDTAGVALAWTAVDAVAPRDSLEFATQLDGGGLSAFGPDSTVDLAGLPEGPHAFLVQSRDPVGHVGSAVRNFTVDLTPPAVSQTAGPMNGGYADSMVTFGWSGTDNLSAPEDLLYAYQLDGSGYSADAAVTTVTFHNLSPGPHTFDVRPTDAAGNTGVPLSVAFEVDVLDPETAITAGPAEGDTLSVASAAFDFTGTDDKSPVDSLRFAYRVDAGSYSPFSLTTTATLTALADGPHTFEVKARDLAGNEDPTPAARTFIVDATAPSVALTAGPVEDEQVNVTAVDFAWTGNDAVTSRNDLEFATSVDGGTLGSWTADSTASLTSLSEGLHSFEVRARDLAGHEGSVIRHYRVDLTAPFVDPPTAQVKDEAKVRFTLTANDVGGIQSFHVQVAEDITFNTPVLETTLVSASPATLDFQGSYGNTYYARTLATDIAGNQSGYSDHSNGAVISQQPDLLVTQVQAPTTAYSGQSMLVAWTVADSGLGGTNVPQWSDRIYLSPTPTLDLGTAVELGTTQNLTYLNVNESYTNQGIFTLPNGISGTFYAIVVTDVLDELSESDAGNNLDVSAPVDVSLSASADLQVTALSVPSNAFSGDPITVSWTVQNLGTGRTDVDNWYDTVFLSPDPSLDYTLSSGSIKFLDRPLGRLQHVGALDPDTTYNAVLQVTIPPEVSGTQYLFVWSDINVTQSGVYVGERGNVFENVGELNNAGGLSDNIAVTLTPPADLVVDSFTVPATAASGQALSLSWTVKNTGLNPTFENFWNDLVYMSTDDQFGGDALVATVGHNGVLDRDSTYTAGAQIQLSPSLSGSRWFFVVTDGTGLALELDDTNNTSAGAMTDISLSPWPDLVVTSVVAQDTADAGSSIPVSWRVQNQGTGALPSGTWFDRIYLSGSPTFDPNTATLLREITVSAATGNVHGTTVTLSSSLNGTYYLFAVADSRQNVFENTDEGNNVSPAKTLQVVPHGAVDLAVDNLSLPGTLYSGGTFPISWTVTNLGAGRTLVSSWGEQVYLSTDDVLSTSTDLRVLGTSHSGALDSGAAYTQNKQFTVPNGFSGDYYVLVVTAPGGSGTGDVDLTNNTVASPAPITVDLTPAPDLAVSSVQATGTPLAGQSIRVHWTVDNLGSGSPLPTDWTMSVYLSQDPLLGGDLHLGSQAGGGSLAPAASYQDSMDVELPSYISGPYYLVVKADAQNQVYEAGAEGNNTLATPVNITFPAPADLAVTGVTGPATATPGDPVTVSWTLANVGGNAATGVFREAVYVSLDSEFVSTEDPLVGVVERSIDLAPGASIEMQKQITLSQAYLADLAGNITRTLPGIPPGDYYFLVRTNIRANIRELNFDNNLGHADQVTTVDVPVLTIDVPETFPLGDAESSYWRIPTPSDLDMSVTVSSDETDATNELFVAFNRPPALNDFDFTGPAEFTANPSLLVPSTQAGDYYVLVRTRALPLGASTQNLTLKAHAVPFSIASVSPDAGGTQGEVSCTLRGAGFRDSTQVYLRFANNLQIHPVETTFINTTELRLRWDLSGVPEATYDVVAMNGTQAVVLSSGFRVEAPLDLRLEATAVHPDVIRDNSTAYFTFKYRNAANWNVPYARIRVVYPASANLVSLSTGDKLYSRSELLPGSTIPISGDVYAAADSTTGSSLQVLDLLAVDTAPGEEVVCSLGLKEFPGSPFSVRAFSEILDTGSFLNSEAERIEAVRNAVLLDPGSYSPATVVLAADADAFRDSALTRTYVDRGLLSTEQLAVYSVTGFGSRVQATAPMSADRSWLDRIRFSTLDATPPESCLVTNPTPGCVPDIDPVGTVLPDCAVCFDAQVPVGYLLPEEIVVPVPGGLCENMSPDIDADAKVVSPCDPNQITGPAGYGDESWISAVQPSFYTVDFENLSETATAPAQVVTVQVPLDPGFDLASFRLGDMGFGVHVVSVPTGSSSFTQEQYYDDLGLVVRIVAGVDIQTRMAFWTFSSLDPNTLEPPTNPYIGFLPVNDPYGNGQGFVTYTVSPSPGAVTGTVVSAQAGITFDTNPALSTNLASNTLDAGIPSSAVVSASPVDPTTYDLQWTGNDPASGSGLRDFTLYVSQDSGPFLLLQGSLNGSLYRFSGETGHVYGFFTLARDNSGNIEPVKTQPEEEVGVGITGTPDDRTPLRLGLLQNSPNPFRSATMIRFTMPEKGRVTLNIFNVAGRLVRSVYDEDRLPAGVHDVEIRSDGLASGVYFYRLQVGHKRFTRKMLLIH